MMKEQIQFKLRREFIDKGRKGSRFNCPIALELKNMFPKQKVIVTNKVIVIGNNVYKTPKPAANFMARYDYTPKKKDVPVPNESFVLQKICNFCSHPYHADLECFVKEGINYCSCKGK